MSNEEILRDWENKSDRHCDLVYFLEWLEENQAIYLGPQNDNCPFKRLDDFKPDRLADRFLGIDRKALELARRELINNHTKKIGASIHVNE